MSISGGAAMIIVWGKGWTRQCEGQVGLVAFAWRGTSGPPPATALVGNW